MNGRVLHFESPDHREIDRLLPWYASGAIEPDQRDRVDAHLAECVRCQRELEWLQSLPFDADALPAETEADIEQALQRLRGRLDAGAGQRVRLSLHNAHRGWRRAPVWTRWALAAQVALCCGLVAALLTQHTDAPYHTLGAANPDSAAEARLAVVFDPSISLVRVNALLQASGARIVDGPTATGAYVLAAPRADADKALARLRADRGVRTVVALSAPAGR